MAAFLKCCFSKTATKVRNSKNTKQYWLSEIADFIVSLFLIAIYTRNCYKLLEGKNQSKKKKKSIFLT